MNWKGIAKAYHKEMVSGKKRVISLLSNKIIVHKNVFPSNLKEDLTSKMIARNLHPKKGDSALDMGTATGIFALILAKWGVKKVIATRY